MTTGQDRTPTWTNADQAHLVRTTMQNLVDLLKNEDDFLALDNWAHACIESKSINPAVKLLVINATAIRPELIALLEGGTSKVEE